MNQRKTILGLAMNFIDDPEGSSARFQHYCESTPESERKTRTILEVQAAHMWARSALQSVSMPHRYAAALMATDVFTTPCEFPWPAFEVRVPNGLLALPDGKEVFSVLCWAREEALGFMVLWPSTSFGFSCPAEKVHELYENANDLSAYDGTSYSDAGDRAQRMAIRLCMNVILDISTTPSQIARDASCTVKRNARDEAVVTTHVVGRPLDLDCRQDIRDYISGKRGTEPKVTTLVRGHWRNQAHGPGNSLRKALWIHPFYRGHGPMLVRPTRLGFRYDEGDQ